mgnify:CR=1 FL=1
MTTSRRARTSAADAGLSAFLLLLLGTVSVAGAAFLRQDGPGLALGRLARPGEIVWSRIFVADGRLHLDEMVSKTIGLDDINQGFDDMKAGTVAAMTFFVVLGTVSTAVFLFAAWQLRSLRDRCCLGSQPRTPTTRQWLSSVQKIFLQDPPAKPRAPFP